MVMIINQSAEVAPGQKIGEEIVRNLERCGRISHKSEAGNFAAAEDFIRRLISWGHESVLEHESITMHIITDRGISHELVRHRIGTAITQESQRYVAYGDDLYIIAEAVQPFRLDGRSDVLLMRALSECVAAYRDALKNGLKPEIARAILPNCVKTELFFTANIREWRHILKLRGSKAAHPQMRALMQEILNKLKKRVPVCFEDLEIVL